VWETWLTVVAVALVLIVAAGAGALLWLRGRPDGTLLGRRRPSRDRFRQGSQPPPRRVTIILNPTKVEDPATVGAALTRQAVDLGWARPDIVETTVEDPGTGQTRAALLSGADLVCVIGGDGTVRAVAEVLAGTRTPMGLLARGTGNLLARNLQLPLDNLEQALAVALTGLNRHIDMGWAIVDPTPEQLEGEPGDPATQERGDDAADGPELAPAGQPGDPAGQRPTEAATERPGEEPGEEPGEAGAEQPDEPAPRRPANEHAFLVMGGLGFDAAVMEGTSEGLKARVGWPAYIAGGAKNLLRARFKTTLVIDGGEETSRRARTVVVGNCGRLTGGITLMPDAEVDDGILDVVAITPRGIAAWAGVAAHVLTQRQTEHSQLDRYRCRRALVTVEEPQRVQVDGDVLGEARQVLFSIQPRSLIVRVAAIRAREPAEPSA
jgi:diacylglycerol kinase family enzyme